MGERNVLTESKDTLMKLQDPINPSTKLKETYVKLNIDHSKLKT